jgi:hypothetical protein
MMTTHDGMRHVVALMPAKSSKIDASQRVAR